MTLTRCCCLVVSGESLGGDGERDRRSEFFASLTSSLLSVTSLPDCFNILLLLSSSIVRPKLAKNDVLGLEAGAEITRLPSADWLLLLMCLTGE